MEDAIFYSDLTSQILCVFTLVFHSEEELIASAMWKKNWLKNLYLHLACFSVIEGLRGQGNWNSRRLTAVRVTSFSWDICGLLVGITHIVAKTFENEYC